jgi:hypothetical protein
MSSDLQIAKAVDINGDGKMEIIVIHDNYSNYIGLLSIDC